MQLVKGKLADAMPLIMAHHYTRRRTADPMHVFLWQENGATEAAAVFTAPVNRYFGKGSIELARLVRTPTCERPMTEFLSLCLSWLRKNTRLLFCLAYADQTVGHHGGVYQAASFVYVAESKGNVQYRRESDGKVVSGRSFDQCSDEYRQGWVRLRTGKKYLYVKPLTERPAKLLARFNWKSLPYPKPKGSMTMQRRTKTERAAQAAETTAAIGHNSGDDGTTETAQTVAAGQLRSIIERIERLTEERQAYTDDIKDVYAEAKGTGFDVTAIRTLIRLRKMDQAERQERESILDLYKSALGMV